MISSVIIGFIIFGLRPAADSPVTFSQPAMTLERLLPKLGEAAGVKMEADKSIRNEVVLIRVKDMPVKDLMAKVAQVSTGTWQEEDSTLRLYLDRNKLHLQRMAEIQAVAKQIQEDRTNPRSTYSPGSDVDKDGIKFEQKIFDQIPAADLASIEPPFRAIYAYPASQSQRRLPKGAWDFAMKYLQAVAPNEAGLLASVRIYVYCRSRTNAEWLITFHAADGTRIGDHLLSGMVMLHAWDISAKLASLPQPNEKITISAALPELHERIRLAMAKAQDGSSSTERSTSGYKWSFVLDPDWAERKLKPLSDQARQYLANPDKSEPLWQCPGKLLADLAESQRLDIIASIPDDAMAPVCSHLGQTETAEEIARILARDACLQISISDRCLLVEPSLPRLALSKRLNRAALRTLTKPLSEGKSLGIDLLADYAAAQPAYDMEGTFEKLWLDLNGPGTNTDLDFDSRRAYKFFGMLGKKVRDQLRAGLKLPLSSAPPAARQFFNDNFEVFRWYSYGPNETGLMGISSRSGLLYEAEQFNQIGQTPPTQVLLAIKTMKRPVLYGIAGLGSFQGLDYLGFLYIPTMGHIESGQIETRYPRYRFPTYRTGERSIEDILVLFHVDPSVPSETGFRYTFMEDRVDLAAPVLPFAETPLAFRQWVERCDKYVEEMRKLNEEDYPTQRQEVRP